jgi:hypothetical protein
MNLVRWNESDGHPKFLGGQNWRPGHSCNPSTHFLSSSLPFTTPQLTKRRSAQRRRTTVPPWAPSPVRVPTDGWMCRRRVAPRWGPTHVHRQGSRSDGVLRLLHAPRLAAATMARLERATMSCASRSIHAVCGSTTAGGGGHGICAQR